MNLEKIRPTIAITIILCASPFFVIVLSFFLLSKGLFFALNIWQIIGIGIGICVPYLMLNAFTMALFISNDAQSEGGVNEALLTITGLTSTLIITICLVVSYGLSFSLSRFYWILVGVTIGFWIVGTINSAIEYRRKAKK